MQALSTRAHQRPPVPRWERSTSDASPESAEGEQAVPTQSINAGHRKRNLGVGGRGWLETRWKCFGIPTNSPKDRRKLVRYTTTEARLCSDLTQGTTPPSTPLDSCTGTGTGTITGRKIVRSDRLILAIRPLHKTDMEWVAT